MQPRKTQKEGNESKRENDPSKILKKPSSKAKRKTNRPRNATCPRENTLTLRDITNHAEDSRANPEKKLEKVDVLERRLVVDRKRSVRTERGACPSEKHDMEEKHRS